MKKIKLFATMTLLASMGCVFTAVAGIPIHAEAQTIYVSPTAKADGAGTKESPKGIIAALTSANPGDTFLLAGGTYKLSSRMNLSNNGTYKDYITVRAEDDSQRVILDFSAMPFDSANRGIQLTGDYWHFDTIEVTGAGDNGMYIAGNNNIVENCQFYKNRDSGLQLGRGFSSDTKITQWPCNNLIKNCTSFYNYDDETLGENADGFAAKLTVGYGNVFDGCIAYRNSDDGWDLYAKADSGNIGTVIIRNCLSFENGFLPESRTLADNTTTYNTTNGDGIGFKLGGGVMEGDVFLENCLALNNKFHGFSDNSNPGFISMKNCTAINNGINVNADGTVGLRGIPGEENKYNNFDMARSTDSYNSYYGLLSFIDNQDEFAPMLSSSSTYNQDAFRGSVAYSIFQTSYKDGEQYVSNADYKDLSSYESDSLDNLKNSYPKLTSAIFKQMKSYNAIGDKIFDFHKELRNADGSVNLKDNFKLADENLLKFSNGNPIGADLSKSSWDEYTHYDLGDLSSCTSDKEAIVKSAAAVTELFTNKDAVFQNFEIPMVVNGCEITWKSSNPEIVSFNKEEKIGRSSAVYSTAHVTSPSSSTKVTLTAELNYYGVKTEKTFEITVRSRTAKLGNIISEYDKDTFIVARYQTFKEPEVIVTDGSSYDNSSLNPNLFTLTTTYEWSTSKDGVYTKVNGIYTAVPGVFRITKTAQYKNDESQKVSYTYYVFIGEDDCEIDFAGGLHQVRVNSNGIHITGKLTNIAGRLYVAVVEPSTMLYEAKEVMEHSNVQVYNITSDVVNADFIANNSGNGYKVYYVISDRAKKHTSPVRNKEIKAESISTKEEFYNLAQGLGDYDAYTIYNLKNDLDFAGFKWELKAGAVGFAGTFNGNGHKISNVTITNTENDLKDRANMFYKLENGTIMNVDFENINISNDGLSAKQIAIVGQMSGGNISHVNMKNVTIKGLQASSTIGGALVGQISGGINYIDHITLENDENQVLRVGGKYVGGVVANIQLSSNSTEVETHISYCLVKADLGDGEDTGGCIAGILGRIKNDSTSYYTDVNNCFYQGTIKVKGNYNAGIVGSIEGGQGNYSINSNYADVVFIYCKTGVLTLDAKALAAQLVENPDLEYQAYAHKNCNPICGRASTISSDILGKNNVGSWTEYYSSVILSNSFYLQQGPDFKPNQIFLEANLEWDMVNDWAVSDDGVITLR